MTTEHQNELFREYEKKRGGIEKIAEKITEKRKRLFVTVALENMVFGAIVVIMCIVTAFALGVERGKRLEQARAPETKESPGTLAAKPRVKLEPIKISKASTEPAVIPPKKKEKKAARPVIEKTIGTTAQKEEVNNKVAQRVEKEPVAGMRYTVQLISYKQESLAVKEKNKLLKKKIDAFIAKSGKWYQVCVGKYKDMREASEGLKKFQRKYRGCFIRNI